MTPRVDRVDRSTVRALVREELERLPAVALAKAGLRSPGEAHPASGVIFIEGECSEDLDFPTRRPCVIEPHRPCYNSGYCKKLGY